MGPGVEKTIYIAEDPAVILVLDDVVAILEIVPVLLHLLLRYHGDLHPPSWIHQRANLDC